MDKIFDLILPRRAAGPSQTPGTVLVNLTVLWFPVAEFLVELMMNQIAAGLTMVLLA
jgi:hypothetical protein